MINKLKEELARRPDLMVIAGMIPAGIRALDLGCGNGVFLKLLEKEKQVRGLGIEIDQQRIIESVATGISVIHGDLNQELDFAEDQSFDYVVLSRTIQEVSRPDKLINEIVRVGRKAIISFINFGYYRNRLQILFKGIMPMDKNLPNPWYSTPNIHLATIADFRGLCRENGIKVLREVAIGRNGCVKHQIGANLLATNCVFEITKKS